MPRTRTNSWDWSEGLPALPPEILTKDRQRLRTNGDRWFLRANIDGGGEVIIDFKPLHESCSNRFVHIAMLYNSQEGTDICGMDSTQHCASACSSHKVLVQENS